MSIKIRLSRIGNKKKPFYRVVIIDSKSSRNGRIIERVGYYNPILEKGRKRVIIFKKRVIYWLKLGACPTNIVIRILKKKIKYVDI